ncbi:MAG: NAD(P)H-dependent oxidoreductase [Candidatus Magnetomorum sp.]|nr:NAD(P)H-dependent oxidoreductase [Candidatus Magnetomorum sp.]
MKILAINSSPRTAKKSKTTLMLDHLVKGMKMAGAEVDVVSLKEKKIKACIGCERCQILAICTHKDDMTNELLPKWLASDLVLYASPIYFRFFNSLMKKFIDRTYPAFKLFFQKDDEIFMQARYNLPSIAVLAVSSLPQEAEFEALSMYINHMFGKDLVVAEIYRHSAFLFKPPYGKKITDILNATIQAGKELVESRKVFPDTITQITQQIDNKANIIECIRMMHEISKQKTLSKNLSLTKILPEKKWEMLLTHISLIASEATGIISNQRYETTQDFNFDQGFVDMGMDYSQCLKFHESLEKSLNCQFPFTILFKYPTVKQLSIYLAKEVFKDVDGFEKIQGLIPHKNNSSITIEKDVEQLSEMEAEDTLLNELEHLDSVSFP